MFFNKPFKPTVIHRAGEIQNVFKMTDPTGSMDLLEEVKRAMVVFSGVINSACYIYISAFHDLKER